MRRLPTRVVASYTLAALLAWSARPTIASFALGLLVISLGEGLRLWATGYLHKTESLTVAGPYAHLRHPLYLGTLLITSGFAFIAHTWPGYVLWAAFLIGYFGYYLPYKNRIEGARLESLFGDDFRRYAVAVPKLWPRVAPYVPLGGHGSDESRWRGVRFADNNETGVALAVLGGVVVMLVRSILLYWLNV